MESLKRQYKVLLKQVSLKHIRNIYYKIAWDTKLVGIKGARGVGKTTLMLQRIKMAFPDPSKALYISLDDIWFSDHTLVELADKATEEGITCLFIDEVHRMPGWERQIKNIYDFFPSLKIVFTGSSLLEIDHSIADLSRRCLMYSMQGLSFREYLDFLEISFEKISLQDLLFNHKDITSKITSEIDVLKYFSKYIRHGYYPFFITEREQNYLARVNNMIASVIDYDIPSIENIEYATLLKTKQLLSIMAAQTPSSINIKNTAELLNISKNQLIKIFSLLQRSQILRLLYYKSERSPGSLVKPQKVLLDNPSILYALGYADKGKVRESFLVSMLAPEYEIAYPQKGDLLVEGRYLLEVGGAGKGFSQIRDIPDSFVVADDIPYGTGNKVPLWLFGFLY